MLPLNEELVSNIQLLDQPFDSDFINYQMLLNTDIPYDCLTPYINDIKTVTPVHTDLDSLSNFFPERTIHFENFELPNLDLEDGVFETLSTPDLKIFYPEPYIAAPSFVHEDLWFLHILHFQHWL